MAFRYIALQIHGDQHRRQSAYPMLDLAGLALAFERDGIALFSNMPDLCRAVPNGVVVGHLFSKQSSGGQARLSIETAGLVSETLGERLVTDYWGAYVAIIADPTNGTLHVLRDPSGALPCYVWDHNGVRAISSDIETLAQSGLVDFAVDWRNLGRHLFAPDLRSEATAITGLDEVLAGCRLAIPKVGPSVAQPCWSPWSFGQTIRRESREELAEELRTIVTNCVSAWTSTFNHVLLGLSGGLDSSILAASLKRAGVRTHCLTMATNEADGDERRYAGLVAQSLDLPVIEAFHDLRNVDVSRPTTRHLPRPVYYAFGQSEHETKFRLAHELGIDAFFSGIGGDNVFCSLQSATPIVDRLKSEGSRRGLLSTVRAIQDMTGCSVSQAVRMAARRYFSPAIYKWSGNSSLLNPEICASWPLQLDHPWLHAPPDALPGKVVHTGMLARIQGTIDGFSRVDRPPQINPLLSQPIIEFCLSVPTWTWCEGGQNRAVARQAFVKDLPAAIINRSSKGGPDSFACLVIERNRKRLAEQLLDGVLAQHQLIDTARVETLLSDPRPLSGKDCARIAALGEAEAWARNWASVSSPAAPPAPETLSETPSLASADTAQL